VPDAFKLLDVLRRWIAANWRPGLSDADHEAIETATLDAETVRDYCRARYGDEHRLDRLRRDFGLQKGARLAELAKVVRQHRELPAAGQHGGSVTIRADTGGQADPDGKVAVRAEDGSAAGPSGDSHPPERQPGTQARSMSSYTDPPADERSERQAEADATRERGWLPITPDRWPEIHETIRAWRSALTQHQTSAAWEAIRRFRTLTACLEHGRFFEGEDQIQLGQPRLAEPLYDLFEVARHGGGTEKAQREALDAALRVSAPALSSSVTVPAADYLAPSRPTDQSTPSDRQCDILQVLFKNQASDADHRMTTDEIADAVEGKGRGRVESFKRPIADLKERGLIFTKAGRCGGCWLTDVGQTFIKQCRKP
jgi:hypothetical protein